MNTTHPHHRKIKIGNIEVRQFHKNVCTEGLVQMITMSSNSQTEEEADREYEKQVKIAQQRFEEDQPEMDQLIKYLEAEIRMHSRYMDSSGDVKAGSFNKGFDDGKKQTLQAVLNTCKRITNNQ